MTGEVPSPITPNCPFAQTTSHAYTIKIPTYPSHYPIKDTPLIVKQNHDEIEDSANHEALEYFQSIEMTDEEFANLTNNQPPIPVFDEEEEESCAPTLNSTLLPLMLLPQ